MSERNTVLRSLHNVGLAAWFGGSLMGAVGLNGAAKDQGDTWQAQARIASSGWAKAKLRFRVGGPAILGVWVNAASADAKSWSGSDPVAGTTPSSPSLPPPAGRRVRRSWTAEGGLRVAGSI
ncbi:hypothetical protein [Streptomyces sp. B6(2022)]|uniref:hypothetical protein n=1 Tax=Streptomyces sp. B6(2022) TaxID=3404749 RepID=UPI00311D5399